MFDHRRFKNQQSELGLNRDFVLDNKNQVLRQYKDIEDSGTIALKVVMPKMRAKGK